MQDPSLQMIQPAEEEGNKLDTNLVQKTSMARKFFHAFVILLCFVPMIVIFVLLWGRNNASRANPPQACSAVRNAAATLLPGEGDTFTVMDSKQQTCDNGFDTGRPSAKYALALGSSNIFESASRLEEAFSAYYAKKGWQMSQSSPAQFTYKNESRVQMTYVVNTYQPALITVTFTDRYPSTSLVPNFGPTSKALRVYEQNKLNPLDYMTVPYLKPTYSPTGNPWVATNEGEFPFSLSSDYAERLSSNPAYYVEDSAPLLQIQTADSLESYRSSLHSSYLTNDLPGAVIAKNECRQRTDPSLRSCYDVIGTVQSGVTVYHAHLVNSLNTAAAYAIFGQKTAVLTSGADTKLPPADQILKIFESMTTVQPPAKR